MAWTKNYRKNSQWLYFVLYRKTLPLETKQKNGAEQRQMKSSRSRVRRSSLEDGTTSDLGTPRDITWGTSHLSTTPFDPHNVFPSGDWVCTLSVTSK